MCGIAGIYGDANVQRLEAMAGSLRHRGPDDEGFWRSADGGVGFAHRRLAIIDPQRGKQPMSNEDRSIVVIFNGAIYNYRELREDLVARGHRFRSDSDTETIVHLYEEVGEEFPTKLRGMFAIALWDETNRKLLLARDRAGKKPLYFATLGTELLFASEIKAIVSAAPTPLEIDHQALSDYLTWGCVPAPASIYRQVSSLNPAELLVVRDGVDVKRRTFWRLQMLPKVVSSQEEMIETTDSLLRESVKLRLRSDVPVGAFLSGGLDSGIVTAMAAQEYSEKLHTVCVGFEEGAFDERPIARAVAQTYGTDHHEVLVRPDVINDLPLITQSYDQPFADSSAIPSFYVAREARRYSKVVLNGDGGDELFAGYRRYMTAKLDRFVRFADCGASRAMFRLMIGALPIPSGFRTRYAFLHRFIRGMGKSQAARYTAWVSDGFTESEKQRLAEIMPAEPLLEASDRLAACSFARHEASRGLDRMLAADFEIQLPYDLLVKMDIACMAHGLEARSPMLDHELIQTVSRFPEHVKLDGHHTKPILRRLGRRYLPDSVVQAPKRGFEVPLLRWLRGELNALCTDIILSRNGLLAELFDRGALERLILQRGRLDPARWSRRIWILLMLGMWDQHVRRATP